MYVPSIRSWLSTIGCTSALVFAASACTDVDQTSTATADLSGNGSCVLFAAPSWVGTQGSSGNTFGFQTSFGDINNDGYDDLLVGDRHHYGSIGAAFLYSGSATGLSATPTWTFPGQRSYSNLGWSVVADADYNGDGYDDIAVGDMSAYGSIGGFVYVFLGSATGPNATPDLTLSNTADISFGGALAAGDVNGDGFSDLIVGADRYENTEYREGAVYLYLGSSAGLSSTPSWFIEGGDRESYMGHSMAANGDINGDGFDDIVVGQGRKNWGYVHVYLGSANGPATTPDSYFSADQSSFPNTQSLQFGTIVAYAGDTDGDGLDDVLANAPGYYNPDGPVFGLGRVYLFRGTPNGLATTPAWHVDGQQAGKRIGEKGFASGDIDNDGYSDIIVSAVRYDVGVNRDAGRAYAYLGGSCGVSTTAVCTVDGDGIDDTFGYSLSTGDINGDGVRDIAIGAYATYAQPGRVEVFSGLSDLVDANQSECSSCEHSGDPGDSSYCSAECPCDEGDGDCDCDEQCAPGLTCVHNVGADYGWDAGVDVCQAPTSCHTGEPGSGSYCSIECPCSEGEGDCDGDGSDQCAPGLTCVHNVGADYGWGANVDVCEAISATP